MIRHYSKGDNHPLHQELNIYRTSFLSFIVKFYLSGVRARAAACYALPDDEREMTGGLLPAPYLWPWDSTWWKPTPEDRVKELVKAGALITAEIDRIQNA